MKSVLKWLAAAGSIGLVAGLRALAAAVGVPVDGIDPVVQMVIAALIVKGVNWLVGKIPVNA